MNLRIKASVLLNRWRIESLSSPLEHLHMIRALFRVPKDLPGCVVECGTYKGASAANLSLACKKLGRKLYIFDSFCGLPTLKLEDRNLHAFAFKQETSTYSPGQYAGSLEEVRSNISRGGSLDSCIFRPGFFADTLPAFKEPVVQAFIDVDLRSSMEDCLRYLWPLLQKNCRLYAHEARDLAISSLFFDREWWCTNLDLDPPVLVGAGNGLGLFRGPDGFGSDLGFSLKL